MEERFVVLRYCDNHWKALAIATSNYSQWFNYYKARMEDAPLETRAEAEAEANRKRFKEDDESCIQPASKRSKATIDIDALDTTDSDIRAGRSEDPKIAVEVIDDTQPSQ
jgi:hypothetical protein